MTREVSRIAARLRSEGHKTYQITAMESGPLCSLGMVRGFLEFFEQAQRFNIQAGTLLVSSAGPTCAAFAWANKALGAGWNIAATAPNLWVTISSKEHILKNCPDLDRLLNLQVSVTENDFTCYDEFIDAGYQKASRELLIFIRGFLKATGILLDTSYVGKAAFAIRSLVARGELSNGPLVLWHTGGTPVIFNEHLWKTILEPVS